MAVVVVTCLGLERILGRRQEIRIKNPIHVSRQYLAIQPLFTEAFASTGHHLNQRILEGCVTDVIIATRTMMMAANVGASKSLPYGIIHRSDEMVPRWHSEDGLR